MKTEQCLMCVICFVLGWFVHNVVGKCGFAAEHLTKQSDKKISKESVGSKRWKYCWNAAYTKEVPVPVSLAAAQRTPLRRAVVVPADAWSGHIATRGSASAKFADNDNS